MRYLLAVLLALGVTASHATTYKCVDSKGEVVYTDEPCEDWERTLKRVPAESTGDPVAAAKELERQKATLPASSSQTGGIAILPDYSSPPPKAGEMTFPGGSSTGTGPIGGSVPSGAFSR